MLIFFILILLFIFFPSINGLFDILLGLFFNRTTITCRTKRTLFFLRIMGEISSYSAIGKPTLSFIGQQVYTQRSYLLGNFSLFCISAYMRAFNSIVYRLSACHKSNSRRNLGDLSSNIIKHHQIVLNAQRVEQVKHSLGHHRRTAQVMRCPLERRVA